MSKKFLLYGINFFSFYSLGVCAGLFMTAGFVSCLNHVNQSSQILSFSIIQAICGIGFWILFLLKEEKTIAGILAGIGVIGLINAIFGPDSSPMATFFFGCIWAAIAGIATLAKLYVKKKLATSEKTIE